MVSVHIAHRLDIVLLTLVQLILQLFELVYQPLYLHIEIGDVVPDGVNGTPLALNLGIDDHEVLQALLDILFNIVSASLLFLNLLLYLLSLVLQGLYRRCLDGTRLAGFLGTGLGGLCRLTCLRVT